MKKILLIIFCACTFGVQAQSSILRGAKADAIFPNAIEVKLVEGNSFPAYIELDPSAQLTEESFFAELTKELMSSNKFSFQLLNSTPDQLGFTHKRYRLYYNGVEVAYSNLSLHLRNNKVVSASGNITSIIPNAEEPALNLETARANAIAFVGASEYMWDIDRPLDPIKSEYYPKGHLTYLPDYFNGSGDLKLTYVFNIYASQPLARELVFINAIDGTIVFNENLIHTGGDSKGTAVTAYSDTQKIVTDSMPSFFTLRDSTRGTAVVTLNCLTQRNYLGAVDFVDSNNFWNNVNVNKDEYATDAHWGTAETYDYLLNVHNRNSIDNNGFPLVSFMHYDVNYANAFWNGSVMTYGDGNSTSSLRNPLVSIDIVAHEITHGLTDNTSDLIYANESGALNESFSDIFGTALEFHSKPTTANWSIGEEIGGAIRSMMDPNIYGHPDTYEGQSWRQTKGCIPTANNDRCGVHSNSGVQNHWFYLLVSGGVGVNDATDSFNVVGIGMAKAEKIAFRNLTVYLNPSSNHDEARFYAIKSAIDLYGACSPEVESTTNAWQAVGVGAPYINAVSASFSAVQDTAFCYVPVSLDFVSEASNVQNFIWDFGNGTTSTLRNPTALYTTQGTYNVELIGDGGTCGSDTVMKTSYVVVDTATVPCSYTLDDNSNSIVSDCNGRLFDSGGFGSDYGANEDGIITIAVASADYIELDFVTLAVEAGDGFNCNRDYVEVYDGPSTSSPMIGRYCSNFPPANNLVTSSSNEVTIRMNSDAAANEAGFLINWECKSSTQLPVASFSVSADSTCTGNVSFQNESTQGYSTAFWDFGDGTTSTEFHPSHFYYADGIYNVTLTVTNGFGSNTFAMTSAVVVSKLGMPMVENDTACFNANAGLKVNVGTANWYRDTTASSVFSGDSVTLFSLRKDSTLYVKEISAPQTFSGGPLNNIGAGSFASTNDYITFDVHKPILLKTMILFSNKAATRTLDIWDNQGRLVATKEVYVPSNPLRVNINVELQPDSNYRVAFSDRDISLYKNTAGASFPYTVSNLVTIKGSNNSGEYPYFYRWGVSELPCESNFATIKAIVDTTCVPVGINDNGLEDNTLSINPNPFVNQLKVSVIDAIEQPVNIVVRAINGQVVYQELNAKIIKNHILNLGHLPEGVYVLSVVGEKLNYTRKLIKSN